MNQSQTEKTCGGFVLTDDGRHAPALQDQIAAWVNEGGAGGEVVRTADAPLGFAVDIIAARPAA